nr:FHA domain-containing protein [uncultured Butyricicoccus sp.]
MLKFIIGAVLIILLAAIVLSRRKQHTSNRPWYQKLIDWLLARELTETSSAKHTAHTHSASRQRPMKANLEQTQCIRPTTVKSLSEISLSYTTKIGGRSQSITVSTLPFRVGAYGDCDCVLNNQTISRHHFEIIRNNYGELCIRNLSHTNGIIPICEPSGQMAEPIREPGKIIPINPTYGMLRFWAGELFFTLSLQSEK